MNVSGRLNVFFGGCNYTRVSVITCKNWWQVTLMVLIRTDATRGYATHTCRYSSVLPPRASSVVIAPTTWVYDARDGAKLLAFLWLWQTDTLI